MILTNPSPQFLQQLRKYWEQKLRGYIKTPSWGFKKVYSNLHIALIYTTILIIGSYIFM